MSASALICLAPGSEETEAVTTMDLLVRGGVQVTTASVASAAIDVSDGLLADLGHIAERSGCAAALQLVKLPQLRDLAGSGIFGTGQINQM